MNRYHVRLKPVSKHAFPALLEELAVFLRAQEAGAVGSFELVTSAIPKDWDPKSTDRLRRDAFAFLNLPDGSLIALLTHDPKAPHAVVLLGSEGDVRTVAPSLEAFLIDLGKGETGVDDLDEEDAGGRADFKKWLKKQGVTAKRTKPFDFPAYLGGSAPNMAPAAPSPKAKVIRGVEPLVQKLVSLVGRRADDPELVAFVTKELGKKVPTSTTDADDMRYVEAPKRGIDMGFSHDTNHPAYPPLKNGRAYTPYLTAVWLKEKLGANLPFGLEHDMDEAQMRQKLGNPTTSVGRGDRPIWQWQMDAARGIVLEAFPGEILLQILPIELRAKKKS
jgi:hypothetical protein